MNIQIQNSKGTPINDFESWKKAFIEVDREEHWEEGRSACSLDKNFTTPSINNSNGIKELEEALAFYGIHNLDITKGEIEHESKFDSYKNGRMQDLVLWGNSDQGNIVICIEAKVDEKFGIPTKDAYIAAKKKYKENPDSQAQERIEKLCQRLYNSPVSSAYEIKYQLMYYLCGSIAEAKEYKGIAFLPVLVYHTFDYNESKGATNRDDYIAFMKSLKFERLENVDGLYYKQEIEGIKVYSCYIEIELD